jgi:hypothetical protein
LKQAFSVRLTKIHEEIRRLLEEGVSESSSGHAELQKADRRLFKHNSRQLAPEQVAQVVARESNGTRFAGPSVTPRVRTVPWVPCGPDPGHQASTTPELRVNRGARTRIDKQLAA